MACRIGFSVIWIVLLLSHHITRILESWIFNFEKRDWIHRISITTLARLLNSTLIEDLETVCCFLDYEAIKFVPTKKQWPNVDLLSIGSVAQSASQKAKRSSEDWDYANHSLMPLKYLKILFTAFQCGSNGFCMNWHTLFTLKEIACLVIVTYWIAPTIDLYNCVFPTRSLLNAINLRLEEVQSKTN